MMVPSLIVLFGSCIGHITACYKDDNSCICAGDFELKAEYFVYYIIPNEFERTFQKYRLIDLVGF
jgi:hypothetical protein